MNIIVTGGAGFIGSHLCGILLDEGHNVICIDNFNEFYDPSIKRNNISEFILDNKFDLKEGDILDKIFLEKVFTERVIDFVIHLAAMAGVRNSILKPEQYYNVNVNGTLNILEAMKQHNVKNLIFASSSSIYGNNKKVPFSESDSVDSPISPYAATKKAGELLCYTYHHLYNFNITCLRFFTVYGNRQRPDLAIYKFTKALFENKPIPFYGDGSTRRDYTHVSDIVHGILNAIKENTGYSIYNLGESQTISLNELLKLIEINTGQKAILDMLPMQAGDVNQTFADISKAKAELAYAPKVTIEEGIKDFVQWYRTNLAK